MQGIDRHRFDVCVASCGDGPFTERIRSAGLPCEVLGTGWPPELRRQTGTDVRNVPWGYAAGAVWLGRSVRAFVRYLRGRHVDLVHANYYHFHAVAGLACRLTGRKCVWHWRLPLEQAPKLDPQRTSHGEGPVRIDPRWQAVKWLGTLLRPLAGSFVWNIANSESTAQSIRPIVGNRITVIYNGLPLTPPAPDRTRLRDIVALPESARVVGLVGAMQPRKGHVYFLEAAAKVCVRRRDVHFVYIGGQTVSREAEYNEFLLRRRAELGLEDRVHFVGARSDAAQLVGDFDIATVCSLPPGEGFGMVIVEAMAQGVPVISTNVGAAREIIEHDKTGILIPAADAAALASAVENLLSDEEKRRRIGRDGNAICRARFDIRRTVREIEQLYSTILNQESVAACRCAGSSRGDAGPCSND
jgi:glycosyltransferase involved in cell wall biosynthesis